MAPLVKMLSEQLWKPDANPQCPSKKSTHKAHTLKDQHWGGGDRRIPRAHWPASLPTLASSRLSEEAYLKNLRWRVIEEGIFHEHLATTCTQIHIQIYLHTHRQEHTHTHTYSLIPKSHANHTNQPSQPRNELVTSQVQCCVWWQDQDRHREPQGTHRCRPLLHWTNNVLNLSPWPWSPLHDQGYISQVPRA